MRLVTALVLGLGTVFPRAAPAQQSDRPTVSLPVTVFIVRHAEKGPEEQDPGLTAKGLRRAADLARTLEAAEVTALFATEFKRTKETLAPLARVFGLTPTIIGARDVEGLVARLRALPPGGRAVVASHSNLVHLIVARLSGVALAPLTEQEYDRLFVVTLTGDRIGSAVVLRYGEK